VTSYIKVFFIIIYTTIFSVISLFAGILDRSHNIYFMLSRLFGKGVLAIARVKLKISGLENIDKNKSYIFVSNHSSQFDIPSLQVAIPQQASIVYKKELTKIPLFGWQMRFGPYIMIDRQNVDSALKSIEMAKKLMSERGRSILLFAEGSRSKTGEVQPFKRGAFYLASRVGHPVVPVSISGANKILPKGKFKIKKGVIHIHFASPIETGNISTRKEELELMEKVRNVVIENIKP
jgi:1-acyl-sn-glycerol-3-phosphate acyltransferase